MRETWTDVTTRGGVRLHVTIYEEAATAERPVRDVLLLHGWPNSGRAWGWLAEAMLLSPSYRLVAPDFRGFGGSEAAAGGYTCAQFADDAQDVAAALGLTGYAVVGHSMGGKIAQLFASRQPAELAGLALIAPAPLAGAPVPEEKKAAQRAAHGDAEKTRQLLSAMAARPLPARMLAVLTEDGLRAAPAAWNGWLDPMRGEDLAAEAGKVAAPTLVVGGEKDPLRTEEQLRQGVVDRIPGAGYAGIPHVGHLAHLEAPEALAALLVNFLDRLPATPGPG